MKHALIPLTAPTRTRHLMSLTSLACLFALPLTPTQAQENYAVGQHLNAAQIQALGARPTVRIDGRTYQILRTRTVEQPSTVVLDPQGVVGLSYHEVLIAELPSSQLRQQLAPIIAQATEIKTYDNSEITLLRFATLEQAATALATIRQKLPQAEVGLPITTSQPKLN